MAHDSEMVALQVARPGPVTLAPVLTDVADADLVRRAISG